MGVLLRCLLNHANLFMFYFVLVDIERSGVSLAVISCLFSLAAFFYGLPISHYLWGGSTTQALHRYDTNGDRNRDNCDQQATPMTRKPRVAYFCLVADYVSHSERNATHMYHDPGSLLATYLAV